MELSENKLQELKNKKISINNLKDAFFIRTECGPGGSDPNKIVEVENIMKLLNENICSFKEIIDKFKSIEGDDFEPCLSMLLWHEELFEKLIKNNLLTKDDLEYLLNKIDNDYELRSLCDNISLIKHILNEFVLNKELVDRFNMLLDKTESRWCKKHNIHTVFEFIEDWHKNYKNDEDEIAQELLKLNELNEKVYLLNSFELNKEQKIELIEVLRDNEIAKNVLIQIVENHLEDTYDFESLKNLLAKDIEKKKIKLNF